MAAAASPLRDDYVADWLDEIQGVVDVAASFSPVARAALVAVIDSFAAEDGFLPRAGWRARMMLATTPRSMLKQQERALEHGRRSSARY